MASRSPSPTEQVTINRQVLGRQFVTEKLQRRWRDRLLHHDDVNSPGMGIAEQTLHRVVEFAVEEYHSALEVMAKPFVDDANRSTRDSAHRRAQVVSKSRLLRLPPELLLMIVPYLDFGDIERLRRTCLNLRFRLPVPLIRRLRFPYRSDLYAQMLSTCRFCLVTRPEARDSMIETDFRNRYWPLSRECLPCALQRGVLAVGETYTLCGGWLAQVCRWCGEAIVDRPSWRRFVYGAQFHGKCRDTYTKVILLHILVRSATSMAAIIGGALCWAFYRRDVRVLAPTITNFILTFVAYFLVYIRGKKIRTYHWSLLLELAILGLWVPPVYAIVTRLQQPQSSYTMAVGATLFFISANMFIRLINVLGNLLLLSEYKFWQRHKTPKPPWGPVTTKLCTFLIFWTYPQSIEQDYPPRWWFGYPQLKRVSVIRRADLAR